MNGIIIGLIILAIIFYFKHIDLQACNGNNDCNLYNNQDKKSACDPICEKDGKVYKSYNKGNCECQNPVQLKTMDEHLATSKTTPFIADIELYTNVNDSTTILPANTPNDILFNNKNVLQKHEKDRLSSLIFG